VAQVVLPGAFDIVPDEETGLWRSVRPNPFDPKHLRIPRRRSASPPVETCPPSFASAIQKLSTENKRKGCVAMPLEERLAGALLGRPGLFRGRARRTTSSGSTKKSRTRIGSVNRSAA